MTAANIPPEIREYLGSLPADQRSALAAELAPDPRTEAATAMRAMRAGGSPNNSPEATAGMGRPSIFGNNDDGGDGGSRRDRAANAIRDFFSRGDRAPSDPVTAIDTLAAHGIAATHDGGGHNY